MSLEPTRPPIEIPGYEPQRFLGAGAYGEVWVAINRNTGRQVAIKFYAHRGGLDWSLLSREVEKLVLLSADRYVVQLLDVGWDADPPYYVMEYLEQGSLDDLLQQRNGEPFDELDPSLEEVAAVAACLVEATNPALTGVAAGTGAGHAGKAASDQDPVPRTDGQKLERSWKALARRESLRG